MSFFKAIEICLIKKYCTWKGRASRSEYWYFFLFYVLLQVACTIITGNPESNISKVIGLILFLPNLSVLIRRFHDINKSALWALFPLISILILCIIYIYSMQYTSMATIILYVILLFLLFFFYLLIQKGTPYGQYNKYNEN